MISVRRYDSGDVDHREYETLRSVLRAIKNWAGSEVPDELEYEIFEAIHTQSDEMDRSYIQLSGRIKHGECEGFFPGEC